MASMDWDDFLRHEAVMYRQLAEKTENVFGKQELLDLAAVCEEVANTIEDLDRRVAVCSDGLSIGSGRRATRAAPPMSTGSHAALTLDWVCLFPSDQAGARQWQGKN